VTGCRSEESEWYVQGALVNRGDSIKRRRRQRNDGCSSSSARSADQTPCISDTCTAATASRSDNDAPRQTESSRPVRVVVLGDDEVGKTALLQQFMTSVYMAAAVQNNFGTRLSNFDLLQLKTTVRINFCDVVVMHSAC